MSNDYRVNPIERPYRSNNDLRQRYREQPQKNKKKEEEKKKQRPTTDRVEFSEMLRKKLEDKDGFDR